MQGLSSILWLFCYQFKKFYSTRAPILVSIYHLALKLLENHLLGVKCKDFAKHTYMQRCY